MRNTTKKSNGLKTMAKISPFVDFFKNASLKKKREVFEKIITGANEDQRKVLREYDKKFPK